ncbi:MAG: LytR/AlgR family response regulator transcription factor [Paludibacter sp.]
MNIIRKVLIVDDEEKARLYLASILSEMHPEYEIQLISTPSEALFLLNKQQFDVILLDVEMQGMTGIEMANEMQNASRSTPIIFVSAYKKAEFIQKALRLNAVDYIDKPVDPFELEAALTKAFQQNKNTITTTEINKQPNRFCLLTDLDERFVDADEILYFQSNNRYSTVYFTDGTNKVVRYNLVYLMKVLPEGYYLHVSRQNIVNVKYIRLASKSNKTITLGYKNIEIVLFKIFPNILSAFVKSHSIRNMKGV